MRQPDTIARLEAAYAEALAACREPADDLARAEAEQKRCYEILRQPKTDDNRLEIAEARSRLNVIAGGLERLQAILSLKTRDAQRAERMLRDARHAELLERAKPIVSRRQAALARAREDEAKLAALVDEAGAAGIPVGELFNLRWPELYQAADPHNPTGEQDAFSQRRRAYQRAGILQAKHHRP